VADVNFLPATRDLYNLCYIKEWILLEIIASIISLNRFLFTLISSLGNSVRIDINNTVFQR